MARKRKGAAVPKAWREFARRAKAAEKKGGVAREGWWSESYDDGPEGRRAARRRAKALRAMGHVTKIVRQPYAPFGKALVLNVGRNPNDAVKPRKAAKPKYRFEIVLASLRSPKLAYQYVEAEDVATAKAMAQPKHGYRVARLYRVENAR